MYCQQTSNISELLPSETSFIYIIKAKKKSLINAAIQTLLPKCCSSSPLFVPVFIFLSACLFVFLDFTSKLSPSCAVTLFCSYCSFSFLIPHLFHSLTNNLASLSLSFLSSLSHSLSLALDMSEEAR